MITKKIFNDGVKEYLNKYAPTILSVSGITAMTLLRTSLIVNQKRVQVINYSYRDLEKVYKRYRRAVSNNYLKMHHEPMRRRWES